MEEQNILYRIEHRDRSFWYTQSGIFSPLNAPGVEEIPMPQDARDRKMLSSVKEIESFKNFFSDELLKLVVTDDEFVFNRIITSQYRELLHGEFIFDPNHAIFVPIDKQVLIAVYRAKPLEEKLKLTEE